MNTSRLLVLSFSTLFLLFLLDFTAAGQDLDSVTISGRVVDQNNAAIAGVQITAILATTNFRRVIVSDSSGRYRLTQLPPGEYQLSASANGFASQSQTELRLISGQHAQLNFELLAAAVVAEPVTVVIAHEGALDVTRTVVGGTITSSELEHLPIHARSPLELIFTLPGVTEGPLSTRDLAEDRDANHASTPEEAGSFALAGGAAYSNNVTIDGLDNNDDRSARERFQPSLEAIEEVQVITNQFSAEYGRASGGRVNLRTSSGSTQYRGRAYFYFRDESLNANTFRNNSLGIKRLPLQEHNPGFTLGGPVRLPAYPRDRTFFFAAYEYDTLLDHALIDTLVPVGTNDRFPLPSPTSHSTRRTEDVNPPAITADIAPFVSALSTPARRHTFSARFDHNFNEMHTSSMVLQLGWLSNLRQFGGGNRLAESLQAQSRNSGSISFSDNFVLSSSVVNQARIQFSVLSPGLRSASGAGPVVLIAINDPLSVGDPARRSGTLVAGTSTAGGTDRRETRIQIQDIVAATAQSHSFKLGIDFQRINSRFIDLADASGTFSFASAGDFLASIPSRFRQNFRTESAQRNSYLGVFLHDEWRPLASLTVGLGLRYERESILDDSDNFGPRLSFAWDPLTTGKTVIRAGGGIFYNRALLRTIDDFTLGQQQLFFDTNDLRDPLTGHLMTTEERRAFIRTNLRFPEPLTLDSTLVKRFAVRNTAFSRRLDPELRIPESYQWSVGVERDLGAGFVAEANYIFNRGIHLWREFNANAPRLPAGYDNFSEYLTSRDFANFRNHQGVRPLYNASTAGELVRFTSSPTGNNPNNILRMTEFGVPISLINLNSVTSTTAVEVALATLNHLRPDPTSAEVEQLISAGNSFYNGLLVELRRRFIQTEAGFNFSFRAGYTMSRLIDDGVVNTSNALVVSDFRRELARSLLDRRHRFVFAGTFKLPPHLSGITLAPIFRVASGAPFNISLGGLDRNLDDVSNDRPSYSGDLKLLRWRSPGEPIDPSVVNNFHLPRIGETGNLPRNAGTGPGTFSFDLNITREFHLNERIRVRPSVEFDNVLNKSVFSFGSEFVNFTALSPTATAEQRQSFLDSFLVTTRTQRHRQIRLGVRIDF